MDKDPDDALRVQGSPRKYDESHKSEFEDPPSVVRHCQRFLNAWQATGLVTPYSVE